MSNETKRDVFEGLLKSYMYSQDNIIDEVSNDGVADRLNLLNTIASTRYRYEKALPDDLPVIPKAVSEYIEDAKSSHYELLDAMTKWTLDQPVFDWIHDNSDTFARAWLDGVCIVYETGEIVKLEAEK